MSKTLSCGFIANIRFARPRQIGADRPSTLQFREVYCAAASFHSYTAAAGIVRHMNKSKKIETGVYV